MKRPRVYFLCGDKIQRTRCLSRAEILILVARGERYPRFDGKAQAVFFEKTPLHLHGYVRNTTHVRHSRIVYLRLLPLVGNS